MDRELLLGCAHPRLAHIGLCKCRISACPLHSHWLGAALKPPLPDSTESVRPYLFVRITIQSVSDLSSEDKHQDSIDNGLHYFDAGDHFEDTPDASWDLFTALATGSAYNTLSDSVVAQGLDGQPNSTSLISALPNESTCAAPYDLSCLDPMLLNPQANTLFDQFSFEKGMNQMGSCGLTRPNQTYVKHTAT
jgi:hypothetical protein